MAVLSSRGNADRRQLVRETWGAWALKPENKGKVAVRFVVGMWGCPEAKKNKWDCQVAIGDPEDTENVKIDARLKAEAETYKDVAIVPTMDTYRNLPTKLKLFYRSLWKYYRYDYVLKIDDDTYTNIPRILSGDPHYTMTKHTTSTPTRCSNLTIPRAVESEVNFRALSGDILIII